MQISSLSTYIEATSRLISDNRLERFKNNLPYYTEIVTDEILPLL